MKKVFLFLFLFFMLFGCGMEPQFSNTPEGVVRKWQEHMDKNQFEKAKKLSTPETQVTITSIEALLTMDQEPIPIDTTEFITLNCQEKANDAVCKYTIKLEGEFMELEGEIVRVEEEIIADSFLLKKIGSNWLVDIPEEMADDEEMKGMEEILDELLKEKEE